MDTISLKKYIYENNKIIDILDNLGCHNIRYHDNQNYYSATQPDGDNPQGVVISNNSYLNYISWSRNITPEEKADIITLIENIKKISFIDAFKYLHTILGLDFKNTHKSAVKQTKLDPLYIFKKVDCKKNIIDVSDINILDNGILNDFIPLLYIGWVREGIMSWTAKKFNLAFSYKKKRIIIPHYHWLTGDLVGINSRTIIENAEELGINKYWITPTYKKGLNVYGLKEHYNSINNSKYITIFEGEKSVLKRDSLRDETGVAVSGKFISDEQVRIICGLNINEVVIAFDKDVSIEEIRHSCSKFYKIRKVSYIYDKWNILGKKDSPADATNKNYQFLFDNRVVFDNKEYQEYKKGLNKNR